MTTTGLPTATSTLWRGAIDWEHDGEWHRPWRIPLERAGLTFAPGLVEKASMPAGVRLSVRTDATRLRCTVRLDDPDPEPFDLIVDDAPLERRSPGPGTHELVWELPGRPATVTLWLPQYGQTWLQPPTLTGGELLEPAGTADTVRWTCYGSSITECHAAAGPAETWPALIARERGWDLTCLGYGGQCHLDPVVIDTIADRPADLLSLCLGINVYGKGTFDDRTWPGQVAGVLGRLRAAHPGVPILVQSPIISPEREQTPNATGMTLENYRDDVHRVVTALAADDDRLHLLDGRDVVAPADAAVLYDGLHPDADGYRLMARRIGPALDAALAVPTGSGSR